VLNIARVGKELAADAFLATEFTLIIVSTCFYAGAALALATQIFSRETVIFRT
jgi:hypothetical protein